jgi:hypothetical protein
MATPASEKLGVVNSDVDGATKAVTSQSLRERRRILLIWVTREFVHVDEDYQSGRGRQED